MNPTSRNRPTAAAAISSPSSRAESGEYFEIRRERERIAQFVKNGDLSEASKITTKAYLASTLSSKATNSCMVGLMQGLRLTHLQAASSTFIICSSYPVP